jgi:hypothetical protein
MAKSGHRCHKINGYWHGVIIGMQIGLRRRLMFSMEWSYRLGMGLQSALEPRI